MEKKRRVIIFCSSVATAFGGTETYVIDEARYLSKYFNMKLVGGRGDINDDFKILMESTATPYDGFPMISRNSLLSGILMKSRIHKKLNSFDLETLSLLFSFRGLKASLKGADLIEVNYPLESIVFLLTDTETKKIMHMHGPWFPPLYKFFKKTIDRRADMLITCSEWSRKTLGDLYDIRGVEVVHNGVDPNAFAPQVNNGDFRVERKYNESLLRIGTVGRLGRSKGTDVLCEVARTMNGVAEFFAVGPVDASFSAEASGYKIPNLHFLGPLPNKNLPDFYNFLDCFVLPSRVEPFGITVLEAMSSGKPVVASRVGGIPEIIKDDVDGILVPPGDGHSLLKSLSRLAESRARREDLGCAARSKVVNEFSLDKTYELVRSLYSIVLEDNYVRPK